MSEPTADETEADVDPPLEADDDGDDDGQQLEYASVDDFAHLHETERDVTVPTDGGGEKRIRIKKLTQRHRDRFFENGITALEEDRELAAEFIDEIVVRPDFAEAFDVDELRPEHLDQFGMFSFQALFWAILDGSGMEVGTRNQDRISELVAGDFRSGNGEPPS